MKFDRPGHPMTLLPAAVVIVLAVLVLHSGTPTSPGAHVSPVRMTSQYNGTNGVTSMQFSDVRPAVTVSETDVAEPYGLYAGLGGLQELGQGGTVLATGNFSSTGWTVTNQSSAGELAMVYSTNMEVDHHGGSPGANAPRAGVVVQFSNPGGTGTSVTSASNVTVSIEVSNWPWLHPKDSLALVLPMSPSNPSAEQLAEGGTDTMNCIASDSNSTEEYLTWSSGAIATDPSGDAIPVSPSSAVFGTSSNATLEVIIPGGATGYVGIQYAISIAVVAHVVTATVPVVEAGVAISASIVVGALAVMEVRRTWSRPSAYTEPIPEAP